MLTAATLSTLFSAIVQGVVGGRIVLLARQTRAMPELVFGPLLLLLGTGKLTQVLFAALLGAPSNSVDIAVKAQFAIAHLLVFAAWWQIFRPGAAWAKALFFAAGLVLAGGFVTQLVRGWELVPGGWGTPFNQLRLGVASVGFAWGAVECFLYAWKLRKQIRLGLASRFTAVRVSLWGFTQASTLLLVIVVYLQIEHQMVGATTIQLLWPAINLINGFCWWFSLMPPAAFERRFRDAPAEA